MLLNMRISFLGAPCWILPKRFRLTFNDTQKLFSENTIKRIETPQQHMYCIQPVHTRPNLGARHGATLGLSKKRFFFHQQLEKV